MIFVIPGNKPDSDLSLTDYPPCIRMPIESNYEGFGLYVDEAMKHSLIGVDRLYVLYALASQVLVGTNGHFYECGVYKGGSAMLLSRLMSACVDDTHRQLHLFDTFSGMPEVNCDIDKSSNPRVGPHKKGDFNDVSLEQVEGILPPSMVTVFHKGYIPETFKGLESHHIAFAHIDVDIHRSVLDCCEFIYPRMESGGIMVFDDYGFRTCLGAKKAVDDFFKDKEEQPIILPTKQAVIIKR